MWVLNQWALVALVELRFCAGGCVAVVVVVVTVVVAEEVLGVGIL